MFSGCTSAEEGVPVSPSKSSQATDAAASLTAAAAPTAVAGADTAAGAGPRHSGTCSRTSRSARATSARFPSRRPCLSCLSSPRPGRRRPSRRTPAAPDQATRFGAFIRGTRVARDPGCAYREEGPNARLANVVRFTGFPSPQTADHMVTCNFRVITTVSTRDHDFEAAGKGGVRPGRRVKSDIGNLFSDASPAERVRPAPREEPGALVQASVKSILGMVMDKFT